MGMFDGIKDAKRGFEKNPLTEGDYVARIDRCDSFQAERAGKCYKVTLTLLAVNDGPHKEGEVVSVIFSDKNGTKQWFANIKAFLGGVLGIDDNSLDEAQTARTVSEEQVMAGRVTRVKATRRAGKKLDEKGQPYEYSTYAWSEELAPEETTAAIGEERVKRYFPNGIA